MQLMLIIFSSVLISNIFLYLIMWKVGLKVSLAGGIQMGVVVGLFTCVAQWVLMGLLGVRCLI